MRCEMRGMMCEEEKAEEEGAARHSLKGLNQADSYTGDLTGAGGTRAGCQWVVQVVMEMVARGGQQVSGGP